MRRSCIKYLFALFVFLPFVASAQTSADLKKRRSHLQEKINYTNKLLNSTRSNQRLSQTELVLLNKKISLREEKMKGISYEIGRLDGKIAETAAIVESMSDDLVALREEYAQMIRAAYKMRGSYDKLLWVFAADDLNQAYRRLKYMQSYTELRKNQASEIERYQLLMADQMVRLAEQKEQRKSLLSLEEQDRVALEEDKKNQQSTLHKLRGQEERLRAQLRAQEKDKEKLNQAISYAIKKEIEAAKNRNAGTFALTPEAKLESSRFEKNRGKLPWPVERGVITSTYGEHPHPTIPGLKIKNNGIDISTSKAADVRSVFEGEVISVIVISGAGKTVMVKHGGYYTAYSNLKDVFVKKGDKVKTKERLGTLLTEDAKTVSHFEIWKIDHTGSMSKENPSSWIYQK